MRLIDAEYLKEHVFACATNGRPLHHMELSELFDAIDDVPTIEPERKTGKWIEEQRGIIVTEYRCSECGRVVRDDTGYDVAKDYPFCHCGAKMKGEDNDKG